MKHRPVKVKVMWGCADWLKVVQGFMTMALFTHLVSIGITFMVAFVEELADDMRVYGAAIGATATTGRSSYTTRGTVT